MIKTRLAADMVLVVFELPEAVGAESAALCGEFNDWSDTAHPLTRTEDGSFRVSVELPAGRRWRFRYLLDGERWENDWAADEYLPNDYGGEDSVVDLTDTSRLPAQSEPSAAGDGHVEPATWYRWGDQREHGRESNTETVLRCFHAFHQEAGTGPIVNRSRRIVPAAWSGPGRTWTWPPPARRGAPQSGAGTRGAAGRPARPMPDDDRQDRRS